LRSGRRKVKIGRKAVIALVGLAIVVVLARMLLTLRWRMLHDSPLMLYVSLLIDRYDAVPYRDIFEMNLPGTYLVNLLLAKTLGYSDLAFRVSDLLHLGAMTAVTYLWTRRIHRYITCFSVVFLPLTYLSFGPVMSLQREALALLPFSSALAVAINRWPEDRRLRAAIAGLLLGLCALIKPFILIGAVPIVIHILRRREGASPEPAVTSAALGAGAAGFALPLAITLIYLALAGALGPFLDIVRNYLPLYARLTGDHVPVGGAERFWYLARMTGWGLREVFWLVPSLCGLVILGCDTRLRGFAWLLAGMMLAFGVYPSMSGQFWFYHWLPFTFVAVIAAGACLVSPDGLKSRPIRIMARIVSVGLLAVFAVLFVGREVQMARADYRAWRQQAPIVVWNGVPDRIAEYLRANLRPGDTVQPLDWNGGAVHGMLLAEADLATRFIYDFHFYHHTNSPYIERLRREFIEDLASDPPRFIVEVIRDRSRVHGPNTTSEFRALSEFLRKSYHIAVRDQSFFIYERIRHGRP
jgi:hypothetical protein